MTANPITPGQRRQLRIIIENAFAVSVESDELDKDGVQRLIENGDRLKKGLHELILECSRVNKYRSEEESPNDYSYPTKFGRAPKPVVEQVGILRQYFPRLTSHDECAAEYRLPPMADGWFVVPYWREIADTYGDACMRLMPLIEQTYGKTHREYTLERFGEEAQRRSQRTTEMMDALRGFQRGCDMLIFPAQFGALHGGKSARRVSEILARTEFHLGLFEVGCMLLTHPERLGHKNNHWIGCAGDEMMPAYTTDETRDVRAFLYMDGRAEPVMTWVGRSSGNFGCATGFVSQL